jgi:Kef-type K+ transport system membrane component KefB
MSFEFLTSSEFQYLALIVGLFIVPRVLQRYRLPSAVTCVAIGAIAGMGFGAFEGDTVLPLLGVLGIVAMFLFAGLDVDFHELRSGSRILIGHVLIQGALLALVTTLVRAASPLGIRESVLVALALITPSTGFILDSLGSFGLTSDERFWVKSKAIATEIVALGVLFVVVQSASWSSLLVSGAALSAMVLALPVAFRAFARRILPYAPKSEFAFLVIVALVCAAVTRRLGVYYLVGAFVVGVTAQRFRALLPGLESEKLIHAVELFASFFIPFYFFKAGLHLSVDDFSLPSLGLGVGAVVLALPLRVGPLAIHRTVAMGMPFRNASRIGLSMLPTLVFTLVIANILRERFGLSSQLYGALVVYALLNTVVPGLFLRAAPPEFDKPLAPLSPTAIVDSGPNSVDSK